MMVFVAVAALGLTVAEEFHDGLPPRFVLRDIPRRISRLQPGMTPDQAYETLNLERTWLLRGIGARWKRSISLHGFTIEHHKVGSTLIALGFDEKGSTKLRLNGVCVLRGPTTIAKKFW
jgi:hypothetical protein